MRKEEILEFIEDSAEKERKIKELTEQRIAEFMTYQKNVLESTKTMISDFFPPQIKQVLVDYVNDKHLVFTTGNMLWFDVPCNYMVRVRLNPNNFNTTVYAGKLDCLPYNPKNLAELERDVQCFKNYVLLKKELEGCIEQVYQNLSMWKERKLNSELEFLNSLNFTTPVKQERYKVTVIVEKLVD